MFINIYLALGMEMRGGPCRPIRDPLLKSAGQTSYSSLLSRLGPSRITRNPCGPTVRRGGLVHWPA